MDWYAKLTNDMNNHALRDYPREACGVILDDFTQEFGATGAISGALTSIVYTTESGTTVDITGTDKADALVMAR